MHAVPSEVGADVPWLAEATGRMNRMYRLQRHIYDVTRRYYLLGRDQMIAGLQPTPGSSVLEIGCGTGRNLVLAAKRYPRVQFFGVDVSTEMLTSSLAAISRHDLTSQVRVAHGDAANFDPQFSFAIPSFDRVMISYSLSMITDWERVLDAALRHLNPGGQLHVVDFGRQERLPGVVRSLLLHWLKLFDVTPRDNLDQVMSAVAKSCDGDLKFERRFRGYAQYAVLTKPAELVRP